MELLRTCGRHVQAGFGMKRPPHEGSPFLLHFMMPFIILVSSAGILLEEYLLAGTVLGSLVIQDWLFRRVVPCWGARKHQCPTIAIPDGWQWFVVAINTLRSIAGWWCLKQRWELQTRPPSEPMLLFPCLLMLNPLLAWQMHADLLHKGVALPKVLIGLSVVCARRVRVTQRMLVWSGWPCCADDRDAATLVPITISSALGQAPRAIGGDGTEARKDLALAQLLLRT